jgi:hypothetical protein
MTDQAQRARQLVEETIQKLGIEPASAAIPGDASTVAYALKRGSARVIVAVHGSGAEGTLRVVAPVVRVPDDAAKASALFRRLLELNARELQGAAFGLFGDDAVVIVERTVLDLDASEVEGAIRGVGRVADRWDDALAAEFGTVRSSDGKPVTR